LLIADGEAIPDTNPHSTTPFIPTYQAQAKPLISTSTETTIESPDEKIVSLHADISVPRTGTYLPTSRRLCRSAWVGFLSQTVCPSVCQSVCPQHNSKTNDPKVFKLGIGNDLGIS